MLVYTAPLRKLIHSQDPAYPYEALKNQISTKAEFQRERRKNSDVNANRLRKVLTHLLSRKPWTSRLLKLVDHFAFGEAWFLPTQRRWSPSNTATNFVCGANFSVEHALSFLSIRHNEIRDLTDDDRSLQQCVCGTGPSSTLLRDHGKTHRHYHR